MYKEPFSSEETLLRHFHNGSNSALKHIFSLYYKPLVYFANKIINDLPQAEDITAESFYKLYIRRQCFDSLPHIKAFLYMACRNACLDWQKTQRRHQRSHSEIRYLAPAGETQLHAAGEAVAFAEISTHINGLPAQCALIIKMIFYQGMKTEEIATALGTSAKTVLNQKLKAIRLIRLALAKKHLLPVFIYSLLG
jgi:RNA polymerase sigma factor (sigma-70 family)